uniref:hypothetical protein n=1 Tax=Amycolatopsis sp. CA-290885 TaxID=3239925 RepID=UPI003F493B3A
MATTTAKRPANGRRAPKKVTPVKGVNFEPKRVRKQVRKGLIRAAVTNKVADARAASRARMEFYRNLRTIKMNRRRIADELAVLDVMMRGVLRDVQHVEDRYTYADLGLVDEVKAQVKAACSAVEGAADGHEAFARRKVYYTEMVVAA